MKIDQLEVENFRGFKKEVFKLSEQFTVFIGDNCTGKTAVLDALAIGIGSLFLGFTNVDSRHIKDDEVHRISYIKGETYTLEAQYPVRISCRWFLDNNYTDLLSNILFISWSRELTKKGGRTTRTDATDLINFSKKLQQKVDQGEDIILPVIAYYGTARLWVQKKQKAVETLKPGSRMRGYIDCLDSASNEKLMLRWFKTMEIAEIQRKEPIKVLRAVKEAVANCVDYWNTVSYDILQDDLIITSKNGESLPFRMLSDGVRNMLAMVADIAYRSAVLNPHLEERAAIETPGIVLIDEIDLHLHPKWQRKVVNDLRNTFPKIQFIATTHSPFIIQSLKDGELINLDKPEEIEEYENKSIEDIGENVMGIENIQRSEKYQEMMRVAEEYYKVLQEAKSADSQQIKQLKQKLDELIEPYSDQVAYHAFLKMERQAAGLGDSQQ
ncbi:SMC domain protein [Rippkaea orientalis PCC 8801]|uniref:SMC domain protein n=1 Tax=Rippkaea orientalis (strain PCC 8801 / RF-1) TaxID=41431 RepID=B7JXF7_RIPO1|nr:AAA family ATPase [Rippkaea orientalis]ACK64714.1 SMC domain protein [Rippkaea orientalis PCC 8801]